MPFKFLKKYHLVQGFLYSLLISQSILGLRIQQEHYLDLPNLIGSQFFLFLMSFSIWISNQFLIKSNRRFFRGFNIIAALLFSINISIVFYYISPFEDYFLLPLRYITILRLFIRGVLIFIITYPVQYYLFRDKKYQIERLHIEYQKQEALHLRLAFLGKQLDPHFLFNSLSVLRAGTDDPWVKSYVNKLSQVYRYSLQKDYNEGLSIVSDEIDFVHSYLSLFQERFEEALNVEINVIDMGKNAYLPRLALQLLIENALKHNQFTLKNPLKVEIFNEGEDILVVRNNVLQHAHSDYKQDPSGVGLKNLKQRYKLLKQQEMVIVNDEYHYIVKIPIIRK